MKYILTFLYLLASSALLITEEENSLIGTWELTERVVNDYDGELSYENYNEYVKLKEKIYKETLSPKIDYYRETKKIVFSSDNTLKVIAYIKINDNNVLIDWNKKKWKKTSYQPNKVLFWKIKDDELIIQDDIDKYTYSYLIQELNENTKKLNLKPESDNFYLSGKYKKVINLYEERAK